MIIPVILSGGSGTRLWPKSRKQYPKQFLNLVSDRSLFQDTVSRLAEIQSATFPLIVANDDHRFLVKEQLDNAGFNSSGIILEPIGRNTAPAIAVAALHALAAMSEPDLDPVLLVLPADHLIADVEQFSLDIQAGAKLADNKNMITFGIAPSRPDTGFGYIKKGEMIEQGAYKVVAFKEKPDLQTAKSYFETKEFLWNSGIFMFRASTYIRQLKQFVPEICAACEKAYAHASDDLDFIRLDAELFKASPATSIDYAIMERTADAIVMEANFDWSDVGSWSAIKDISSHDEDNNVIRGNAVSLNSSNCYVDSESRLVTLLGMKNTIVIDTKDSVLVANLDDAQSVSTLVKHLEKNNHEEGTVHREVHRPWGTYDCVDKGARFQVKRITVNPGAELSSQKHFHRAEHWIVVSGKAEVTCDKDTYYLEKDQSTYIPLGSVHRLKNPLEIPLELIEVQSCDYLGEDDIVRFDDRYGRDS